MEELQNNYNHPTADEILHILKTKMPKIGIATVYRNLKHLEQNKMIIKLKSKNQKTRYDGNIKKHCHLICQNCQKIIDIFDTQNIKINSTAIRQAQFKIFFDQLELHGLCPECQ